MSSILKAKELLKSFYAQFSSVLTICGKFLLAVFVFLMLNRAIGYNPVFSNIFVILVMALISAILNTRVTVFLAGIVILGNSWSIGLEVTVFSAVLMGLLLAMFLWFVPDDAHLILFEGLGYLIGMPALVPICSGLRRSPASIAALTPGIIMHYYIRILAEKAPAIRALGRNEYVERLKLIIDGCSNRDQIIIDIFAVAAVVVIVFAVRKLEADYAWEIAVAAGGVMYIVMMLISSSALSFSIGIGSLIIGTVLSVILSYVFLYFVVQLDYKESERLTFEDDDYYYYVKAVPKVVSRVREENEDENENEPEAENAAAGRTVDLQAAAEEAAHGEAPADLPEGADVDFEEKLNESLSNL